MWLQISTVYVTASLLSLLSQVSVAQAAADDVDTIYNRQVDYIVRTTSASKRDIADYIANIRQDGTWSAVNYSAGCNAQRSSWPAGDHWLRILKMVVAYKGKITEYKGKPELLSALRLAMGYRFANDFSTIGDDSCMDQEYLSSHNCPCGTPGLWGPNWYSNVIQVPTRSGKACTLLRSDLVESELANCTLMASRAYTPFYRVERPSYLSGSNVVDLAVIGISAGLLENNRAGNASRITHAYQQVHSQVTVEPEDRVDGIKPDGSFQQHIGMIYNGNYGKDFSNSLIELELQSLGTPFQANKSVQEIFGFYLEGSRWTTFTNVLRKVVYWDFSVIGRFVVFPIADKTRASAGLQMTPGEVQELGNAWGQRELIGFGTSLTGVNDDTANSGKLIGNRMFWNSDYMVHRTEQTVTTVKMLSTRTTTGECSNSEGPCGFHLSDGVVYTYSTGAEYEDMFAALDYNIPPGITTDYGGVQAGDIGMAAMRYVNPLSKAFSFYKAWFFFPDNVQHVLVSNIQQSAAGSISPIFSVLDQRLRFGDVSPWNPKMRTVRIPESAPFVRTFGKIRPLILESDHFDSPENTFWERKTAFICGFLAKSALMSGNFTETKSLWHAGTGYVFPIERARALQVSVSLESRPGDWRKIGTSKVAPSSKDMFTASIPHKKLALNPGALDFGPGKYSPIEYSVFPATSSNSEFEYKAARLRPRTAVNTETASAATNSDGRILGVAFWKPAGGSITLKDMGIKLDCDRAAVLILKFDDDSRTRGTVSVADPTHGAERVNIKITWTGSKRREHRRMEGCIGHHCLSARRTVTSENGQVQVSLNFPEGGMAGSTVTSEFTRV